jgi:hypothetical protein
LTTRGARPLPGLASTAASRALGRVPRLAFAAGWAAASGFQMTSSLPICWIGAAFSVSQICS